MRSTTRHCLEGISFYYFVSFGLVVLGQIVLGCNPGRGDIGEPPRTELLLLLLVVVVLVAARQRVCAVCRLLCALRFALCALCPA